MARSVYYDPFGSRLQGFHAGMQDEMALQDNTRRARAQDFDYENIKPLELSAARRQEGFNQFADPYARRALGINERNAEAGAFRTGAEAYGLAGDYTGNYQPLFNLGQTYLGQPLSMGTPGQLQGVSDRVNREFLANRGDAERAWQMRLNDFGLNERQAAEEEFWRRNMTPTQQLYALIQSGQLRQQGMGYDNPADFSPYGVQPQQPGASAPPSMGGGIPQYQLPVPQNMTPYGYGQGALLPAPATDALGRPDIGSEAF